MQIRIEGNNGTYELDEVKDTVIKLGSRYFWRDSDDIVRVNGRYYRKQSPLIVKDYNKKYIMRAEAVEPAPGIFAHKSDDNFVILFDGRLAAKSDATLIGKKYYLRADAEVVLDRQTQKYIMRRDAVALSPSLYGPDYFIGNADSSGIVKVKDGLAFKKDCIQCVNKAGELYYASANHVASAKPAYQKVFWAWKNPNFPSIEHVKVVYADGDVKAVRIEIDDYVFPYLVIDSMAKAVRKAVQYYRDLDIRDDCESIRKRLNAFYDERGDDENQAKNFSLAYQTYRGGATISNCNRNFTVSSTFKETGGKKYTFGLEVETSAGLLDEKDLNEASVNLVADSSIGAGEYVSIPLHGDKGMKQVEQMAALLAAKTLVDNRCAVHVHVGGAKDPEGKDRITTPEFNEEFALNAVRLGVQLEDELFASQPPYRDPNIKYCHSIKKFKDINRDNWKDYIGAYVFGPEDDALTEEDIKQGRYKMGSERNRNTRTDRWATGRYKWLNLVNAYSEGRFKTIEFRIFGATTNVNKIKNYVLTSLAFVWFVENKSNLIEKGNVTLSRMFKEAYANYPEIADRLTQFYDARKARFKELRG